MDVMQESLTWKKSLNVHELICLSKTSGLRSTVTYSQSLQLPQTREPKIIMELRTKLIVILAARGSRADTKNTGGRSFQKQASHQQSEAQRTITGFQRL